MHSNAEGNPRSQAAWAVLVLVLVIEAVGAVALMWPILQGSLGATDEPLADRVVLLVAAVIAWAWVCITLGGALVRRASWVRGSAITIHVLMFAAGTGVLQGIIGDALLGLILVVLALIGFFAALLARSNPPADPEEVQSSPETRR